MPGSAAVCPELRWTHDGVEFADSYCFDPHKWLLTGFDCDAFWVADRAELIQALSVLPEYLRNAATESGAVIDYRDWQVPLGRRFRALKLWFVLRWYGVEGLRAHIRSGVAAWRRSSPRGSARTSASRSWRRIRSRSCASGCAVRRDDGVNADLLRRLNGSGALYLTHTKVRDRYRAAIRDRRTADDT